MSIQKEWLDFLREQYPVGSRIKLREMGSDDPCPIKPGSMGTLQYIDDVGTFFVAWDNGRSLGLVIGQDSFSVLPPDPTLLKFYMPLTANIGMIDAADDEWTGDGPVLDGKGLVEYTGVILKAVKESLTPMEAPRGIMCWYKNKDSIAETVKSVFFSVEEREGQLWGVANCRAIGKLSPEELVTLTDYIAEEASCHWGDHFEQECIYTEDKELYGRIYRAMIEQGLLSVMVGHICQPAMEMEHTPGLRQEDTLPASLSRGLLTGVLREELGFNGVITTDATIMGGYTMAMERARAIPASFAAGCDMIVFSTDIEEDISYLREGLHSGLVTCERVDEAVTRILALKAKVCMPGKPKSVPAGQWRKECAERSVTLVKDKAGLLPIAAKTFPRIRLALVGADQCWDGSIRELFTEELERRGFAVEQYDPFQDDLHGTAQLPHDRLTLTVLHFPHASNQTTVRVNWCPKHAMEIPRFVHEEATVVVSLANPYHLQDVPRARTFINAYTATKATIAAVAEKLCGESPFCGENPVDPFCGLFDTRL